MGQFNARVMKSRRKKYRWSASRRKRQLLQLWKKDPLGGAPRGKGIVLKKKGVEQKQPHSGIIKCVRVQLSKNNTPVTAFVPGTGAIKFVDEHDEVLLEGLHGSQGGAVGSMHGIKYKVVAINGVSLSELIKGKKEKPRGA